VTRTSAALGILLGVAAVVVAVLSGGVGDLLTAIAAPPPGVRAILVGVAALVGGWLLLRALERMAAPLDLGSSVSATSLGAMVRGIRFVFLAAAAFSAGIGWLIGNPLPIVIALVIAGVDVAETSFLLLVAASRDR
jgi:hypothetical protein